MRSSKEVDDVAKIIANDFTKSIMVFGNWEHLNVEERKVYRKVAKKIIKHIKVDQYIKENYG